LSILRAALVAAALLPVALPANLSVSTYLRDGLTPTAIASDTAGNVYIAGTAVTDPVSHSTSAMVAKLDPTVSGYLYLVYLDSAASDAITALAVDAAGNLYVGGQTGNPNFPVVGGGSLGTPPANGNDLRAFVTKLDAHGAVLFSALLGGSTSAIVQGIALTAKGQILVSGTAFSSGFPTTPGAYSVPDSKNHWYLMEFDPSASKLVFSATGIGGSSLAFDAAGNIYMAGSWASFDQVLDYPTTPGAYQTTFVEGFYCFSLCQLGFPGQLQHVTKVDPSASTLIYSTGLNDLTHQAGSTTNTGLAVDSAGNAYVTGTVLEGKYPLTVTAPANTPGTFGFLSKLDPAGANLLFSIPVGGSGLQLDSSGALYVGGVVSSTSPFGLGQSYSPTTPPAIFSWIPQLCWPDNIRSMNEAYVMKVDAASGNVQDAQWIDGSSAGATAIALTGSTVWITGTTITNDVPFSAGVFAPENIAPGFQNGAYLSAVDFSAGANAGPAIACVLDSGNMTHVGPVAQYQLISIFGENLGPATGVAAPDGFDTSVAGVSVSFDGNPAQLLYVSASQINVVVPPPPKPQVGSSPTATVMKLTVNGVSVERQFPFTASNLNLFADLSGNLISCPGGPKAANGDQPLALNSDGTLNSYCNPAAFGSTVSFFMHGLGVQSPDLVPAQAIGGLTASAGGCAATLANSSLINSYVYKVDLVAPSKQTSCFGVAAAGQPTPVPVTFSHDGVGIGPRTLPSNTQVNNFVPGATIPVVIWLK